MVFRLLKKRKLYTFTAVFLLLCSRLLSQTQDSSDIISKFQSFNNIAVQEKIFAHTDKSLYLAGETIWIKAYVVYGATHRPAEISKVIYAELLDATSKAVLQAKLEAKASHANGFLVIPTTLPTGNYTLRVYTMWMQNFGPQFFFEQKITVVNSFIRPDWQTLKSESKYSIELFPEGGYLVYDIESTVAFRIKNDKENVLARHGFLIKNDLDTVLNLTTNKLGLGKFKFTPQESASYKVVFPVAENQIIFESINSIQKSGYTMQLTESGEDEIQVKVITSKSIPEEHLYLLVHTRQVLQNVQAKETKDHRAEFIIKRKELGEGVSHITLFNKLRQPLCERLYFVHPEKIKTASLNADRSSYGVRDQVKFQLQLQGPEQHSNTSMSMAVFRLDSLNASGAQDISTYLWLESDLGNDFQLPYNFLADKSNTTSMDLLMMTSGWRRFKWADVFNNEKPVFSFLPEYEGHLVKARLSSKNPSEAAIGYLSIPGQDFFFSTSMSKNGELTFPLRQFDTASTVILQVEGDRPELLSPFSQSRSSKPKANFNLPESFKNDLNLSAQAMQVRKVYQRRDTVSKTRSDYTPFYGDPYNSYNLESYTRFPTMEEVMREFVSEVRVRKQRNSFQLNVLNAPHKTYFDLPPLLLVDGVPVSDADKVMALDPLQVQRIDIVANKYHHAGNIYNGIVCYRTYKGDLGGLQLDPAAVVMDYEGLQQWKEFPSPSYPSSLQKNSRLPDFRTVLFWSPNIVADSKGTASASFYTGDIEGRYMVLVQGLSADGTTITGHTVFNVSK